MQPLYKLVIVGGGTAGWMVASLLSSIYPSQKLQITLVESQEIGAIGVGEATLPTMKEFNHLLGLPESEMMAKTNATFKLGIRFVGWGRRESDYYHPFGTFGSSWGSSIHKLWGKVKSEKDIDSLSAYCYAASLCRENRFEFPANEPDDIRSTYNYGYHFDAALYAEFLRNHAKEKGVKHVEGKVIHVATDKNNGDITGVQLENGQLIAGDFFLDCSGQRALLLSKTLDVEFEDWSEWLLCDSALAVPSAKLVDLPPYTTSYAQSAGWQWKIPLQHRTGNGYVYSSEFISGQEAEDTLVRSLNSEPLMAPKLIRFKPGRYKKAWIKNCAAIGLSSGFLEPLESTSIYLIQTAVVNFTKLFNLTKTHKHSADEFNRLLDGEYEKIRDFLILHYHLNQRDDSGLWRHCRNMSIPESLKDKISLFSRRAHVERNRAGAFASFSWLSVFDGQHGQPVGLDPFVKNLSVSAVEDILIKTKKSIDSCIQSVPSHADFLRWYCSQD